MSDDELELDLPEDRTDFLRSLTMGVRSAREQKAMAEKAMTAPTERMDSGGAFTQIITSVLPLVLGAAIAGKRGGMVGAEVGGNANQTLFALGDKKRKESEAAAKVKYQEASDAEKAALAKYSSGVEGMFRDDQQEKAREASAQRSDARYAASQKALADTFAHQIKRDEDKQAATAKLQQNRQEYAQGMLSIPGTTVKIDPSTNEPYRIDPGEHDRASKIRQAYYGIMPNADLLRASIKSGNIQDQISSYSALTSAMKDYYGYGGALVDTERVLTQAGLPPIGDPASQEGIARFFRGKARGADLEKVLNTFLNTLSAEVKMKGGKYDFILPPAAGTPVLYKGQKAIYTGTFDANGKPGINLVK
jgi:hypothetical protein